VAELALSMKEAGQTTPVIVRPHPKTKGKFEIAAGARRFVAAKTLGWSWLGGVVRQLDDTAFEELLLVENLQREDPDPRAEVELIARLVKRGVHTPEQISAHLGKSKHWAERRVQLLKVIPEILKAWSRPRQSRWDTGIGHFTVDMMSLLGSLPVETQKALAKDMQGDWEGCTSRADLQKWLDKEVLCRLDKAPFDLNDKRFFVAGCGPGCACDSSALSSLFGDDKQPGRCLKPECFRSRLKMANDAKMAAIRKEHGDLPIVTKEEGHSGNDEIAMFGKQIHTDSIWSHDGTFYDKETKDAKKVLVWNVQHRSLRVAWFKRKSERGSSSSGARNLKSSGERLKERKLILQGKRWHLVHDQLAKALTESKHADCTEDIFDLIAIFGLPYCASYGHAPHVEWKRFDDRKKGYLSGRVSYGSYQPMKKLEGKTREEVIWEGLKKVLGDVMRPCGNVGNAHEWAPDMRRVAKLISFPIDERKKEADKKILPPKTWGAVDVHTLEPISRTKQLAQLGATLKKVYPKNIYVLRCTRGGVYHYVTGARADEGKWSKDLTKARKFTDKEANIAKGKSQAEIVPIPAKKASPKKAKSDTKGAK
jgi:ParB/RepB/Spo0J family partition protein